MLTLSVDIGWLLIEFPHRNAAEIPFPTIGVNDGHDRMLVFQLPSGFKFTYSNVGLSAITNTTL